MKAAFRSNGSYGPSIPEEGFERLRSVALRMKQKFFRSAASYHLPSPFSAFRSQIDNPIRRLDDIQLMFDHNHRVHASTRLCNTSSSFRMSSKCRPVVGSSRIYNVLPVCRRLSSRASLMRWASPPESVVEDCPRRK